MNYLLDTCLLSELRKPKPDAGVVAWASDIDETRMFVSVLSLGEIQKGVYEGNSLEMLRQGHDEVRQDKLYI